ncbi:IMPACT family member yvyE [Microbacterium sp. CH12i]|uniref:YigZ family protein n=1 Tax=Microbacterium sp. CH12i TaxID=1479651 RepID=UPI000460BA33|nr:YigZ family protein [Microbacterium sp. CH12i]KDA06150.1 IMPACT family member yvyE [Microbacterium sp. CH12i]
MTRSYPSTIAGAVDHELVIKKSRFIAHVAPVASSEEADDVIAAVKRRGWDARHHCAAVSEALDRATLVDRHVLASVRVTVDHADAGRFDNLLREWVPGHGAVLGEPSYATHAQFEVWVPPAELPALAAQVAESSAGAVGVEATGVERLVGVRRT